MTKRTKLRIQLIIRGTNLAICPYCGNGNAMLDYAKLDDATGKTFEFYECRDCGMTVFDHEAVLVYTKLDAPGMGHLSTYTEVKRIDGERRRG